MPQLTHPRTGVTVDVSDERAAVLRRRGYLDGGARPEQERPAGNASTAAWHDYALTQGKTADELDGLSRDDIRDLFPTD